MVAERVVLFTFCQLVHCIYCKRARSEIIHRHNSKYAQNTQEETVKRSEPQFNGHKHRAGSATASWPVAKGYAWFIGQPKAQVGEMHMVLKCFCFCLIIYSELKTIPKMRPMSCNRLTNNCKLLRTSPNNFGPKCYETLRRPSTSAKNRIHMK